MIRIGVQFLRSSGLEAKWSKTLYGAPCLLVRDPQAKALHQRERWWMLDRVMWNAMSGGEPPREVFHRCTLLGNVFGL